MRGQLPSERYAANSGIRAAESPAHQSTVHDRRHAATRNTTVHTRVDTLV